MSIQNQIVEFLKGKDYTFGGVIEDFIRQTDGAKSSNASRRCRELAQAGVLETRRVQVQGEGPWVIQYRIKTYEPVQLNIFHDSYLSR